jgi:GNAT superfamily N-acetyltransferase
MHGELEFHELINDPEDPLFARIGYEAVRLYAEALKLPLSWHTRRQTLAVTQDDELCAVASIEPKYQEKPPYLYVVGIAVAADRRREGIGSKFIQHICNVAHDQKLQAVHLVPKPDSEGTNRKFYTRLGFTPFYSAYWRRIL